MKNLTLHKDYIQFLPDIFEQSENAIIITDPNQEDNPIIYVNKAFTKILGYEYSEAIGKNCRFLHKNDNEQNSLKKIRKAIKKQKAITTQIRNYKKDGTLICNELTITPIFDKNKKLKFFLAIQKYISTSDLIFDQSNVHQSLAKIGSWELNLRTNYLFWSDEIYNIFEIDKKKFKPDYQTFLEHIHPDDVALVHESYQNSLKSKKKYSVQHRLLMKDGRVKYVEEKCDSYFDKDGKPYKSIGTVQDITERKLIEIELKKTLSLFESYKLALDESSMVSKSDLKGNITYVNEKFCTVSGYSREEAIGKPHNLIRHPDNPKEIFEDLWKTIKSKKTWKHILKNRAKDGHTYWVDTSILPITDENDEIVEYIAVRHDITKVIEQQHKLNELANTDSLTGLGSRLKLMNDLKLSTSPAIAIINIDGFSQMNEFYGHKIGDSILIDFGKQIALNNVCNECKIYHLRGDEYVIFNKNISEDNFLKRIKKTINGISNSKIEINGDQLVINFTTAISFEPKDNILSTVNMALKVAKKKNKEFIVYSEDLSLMKQYEENIKWSKKIKHALDNNSVIPVFQAIVNNKTKAWEKYECLVRIKEEENLISPYFFIDISKKTRYYTSITKVMIEKSFAFFSNSNKEFSINLTIEDILNDEIKNFIYAMLEKYRIGNRVVFEIVESESINNFIVVLDFITRVKSYKCKIAIDDFGTGYSNFEYLARLNADFIKIDGSLIKDVYKNRISEIICKNIVAFAKDLGMKTIAEYVENEDVFNKVSELGIDYSQGYYFTKPTLTLDN